MIDDLLLPSAEEKLTSSEVLKQVWTVGPYALDAYLVGLAAVQRGLQVVYYGDSLNARSAIGSSGASQSTIPKMFTISDSKKKFFFKGTASAFTSKKMRILAGHKGATKALFLQNAVPTPNGTMANKFTMSKLAVFLQGTQAESFVVKPVDGSLSKGVLVGLTKLEVMAQVAQRGAKQTIIEEFLKGPEYRVCVVRGRIAAAYEKVGVYVIGDGRSTIAQLIGAKNQRRAQNPLLRKGLIDPTFASQYLVKLGLTVAHIPFFGERFVLRDAKLASQGGATRNVTLTLPNSVALVACTACKALEIPFAGVDIIDTLTGPSVLELNALPFISAHSFPLEGSGSGNVVAEAIVDLYFPRSASRDLTIALDGISLMTAFKNNGIKTVHSAQLISVL